MSLKLNLMSKIKDIEKFILQRRYFLKVQGIKKSSWRKEIVKRFLNSDQYQLKKWTVDDFNTAWENLLKMNLI